VAVPIQPVADILSDRAQVQRLAPQDKVSLEALGPGRVMVTASLTHQGLS